MILEEEAYLMHYGILRKSGRYPWGSGATSGQRSKSFIDHVATLRSEGFSDLEIATGFGMTTTQFRMVNSTAKNQAKQADIARATQLKDKQYSNIKIGEKMGINESSVRSLLKPGQQEKADILMETSDMLRRQVNEKGVIDIGGGVEGHLNGISKERLATAVSILKDEGYVTHKVQAPNLGVGGNTKTTIKVLAKPGTTYRELAMDISRIKTITEFTENGGRSFFGLLPPINISSKRVGISYAEDGGSTLDGVIYVRPGIDDISLGGSRYAQVRIAIDGTHYLKGMAMYKDNLPAGVDLQFNTNKSKAKIGTVKTDVMKAMVVDQNDKTKIDPDNPFGAIVKQIGKHNEVGDLVEVTSAMNLVNKEGDWDKWKNTISSQVLSKQSPVLAKTQLDMTYDREKAKLDEIMQLTNPVVKKKLLETYANEVDASAVHLKAASLPRQRSQVILPINSLKETEIYAPNFRDGERVALIRYPHGGKFEIPELVVNNRQKEAKSLLGQAVDAVAINSKVAERLSGADFDGDSVLVIPNPIGNPLIKTSPSLERLKNFDPQSSYPKYEGMPKMTPKMKGTEMGKVSNLITDMTIQGATPNELAAAVRHSMVVIDAEKHNLNYKQSAIDNGISNLKVKYQSKEDGTAGGAATLISRAKSQQNVRARKDRTMGKGGPIDLVTGKKMYEDKGDDYVDSKGRIQSPMQGSKKLYETDNAFTLVSKNGGTKIEAVYAEHSNKLKALGNTARKELLSTQTTVRNESAAKAYKAEVDSLTAKLNLAERNRPLERQAQVLANTILSAKKASSPDMDRIQERRVSAQALEEARRRTGAKKPLIEITQPEWNAIQASAISPTRLARILNNADLSRVKELATPRTPLLMSSTKKARASAMMNSGYTQAEIADALGVSLTTLKKGLG